VTYILKKDPAPWSHLVIHCPNSKLSFTMHNSIWTHRRVYKCLEPGSIFDCRTWQLLLHNSLN